MKRKKMKKMQKGRNESMYTGRDTIEWMYGKQFKAGGEWSVRTDNGFRWWPTDRAQTVEVVGEADGPSGERGYYISVRTELFKVRSLDGDALKAVNMTLMPFASLAGPVYDPRRGTLDLCSWALVYEEISPWMNILLSIAAAMQIHEAQRLGDKFGDFSLENAVSGHPENGIREGWDNISDLLPAFISAQGREPSRWTAPEFQHAADLLGNIPPVLLATAGGPGLSAEFPFGTFSSLCRMSADEPHPFYGNGLLITHFFPVSGKKGEEERWIRKALSLNMPLLGSDPAGYGFGSYTYSDGMIVHAAFYPNTLYSPGLLLNLLLSCGARGMAMNRELAGVKGGENPFLLSRSAVERLMDLLGKN